MDSTLFSRGNPVIKVDVASAQDFTDKEGYFFKIASNTKATPIAAATDIPFGLVLDGSQGTVEISALPCVSGHVVKVKLGANVTNLAVDLQLRADGTVEPDDGSGARVIVARPLELGSTDELIDAVLLPVTSSENLTAPTAVVLGNTNGEIGGLTISGSYSQAEVTALRDKSEELADDVRAIYAALVARGILS